MSINLSGRSILIIEDEPLIAMDIAAALRSAQASVLMATTLEEGLRLSDDPTLSAAVLGLTFRGDNTLPLCKRLTGRGVPFVIYTGFTEIPAQCKPGAIVDKLAAPATIIHSLAAILRQSDEAS
jgi:DNA-binding response OmpR family regulator